jgi:hypothetical protein
VNIRALAAAPPAWEKPIKQHDTGRPQMKRFLGGIFLSDDAIARKYFNFDVYGS